jgi:unsaturated rhamnogalacturonyl hydrolase
VGRILHIASALCLAVAFASAQNVAARTAEQTVRPIIERVIRETSFELRSVPLKPTLEIQVLDFGRQFGQASKSVACAFSVIRSRSDTTVLFGMSRDLPLRIILNGRPVFTARGTTPFVFHEVGYDIFKFNDTLSFPLKKGMNTIVVKGRLSAERNVVYLREMTTPGARPVASFDPTEVAPAVGEHGWGFLGPFSESTSDLMETAVPPESGYRESYSYSGVPYTWQFAPRQSVQELVIKADATYRRESYAEWQYPNGTVMLSLLSYADAAKDSSVQSFVSTFCNFTLDNLPLFRNQYERLHAFRGTNHKLIRRGMLDDTGAPALPFVEMALRTHNPRFDPIVADKARYIMNEQVRLNDGTLARYERLPGTVWADDLFMSTPYLMRMGRLTGDQAYFDEAARQVLKFNKVLEDKTTGLYRHGWYDTEKRQSPIAWGRANGWIVWATSEVLADLPLTHPLRKEIVSVYRRHLNAIAARQSDSGLWHQVLDRPDSYEETSCTAMFIIGIARGMKMGILDRSFEPALAKAWSGLQSRISTQGIVKDICRGTEMGEDFDFYNKRERFDNDPRGLGAVITACVEMMSMQGRGGLNNKTQH